MKRSAIARKTPMNRGTATLKARAPITRGTTRTASKPKPKGLKTKQRAVLPAEKLYWDRLATEIGCVACMKDGHYNPHVSIHHVDGRTKPGCHMLVLPLCGPHHQHDSMDLAGRVGVHPYKARFEKMYGTQDELMALCAQFLKERNFHEAPR